MHLSGKLTPLLIMASLWACDQGPKEKNNREDSPSHQGQENPEDPALTPDPIQGEDPTPDQEQAAPEPKQETQQSSGEEATPPQDNPSTPNANQPPLNGDQPVEVNKNSETVYRTQDNPWQNLGKGKVCPEPSKLTDQDVSPWWFQPTVAYDDAYCEPDKGYDTPLALDWNHDGKVETLLEVSQKTVMFDLNADGQKEAIAWVAPKEGLLAFDHNRNGLIDSGAELFGNISPSQGQKHRNGFEALAQLDLNGDKVLDAKDPAFAKLLLWQDLNSDGVSQKKELRKLAATDVLAIDLQYQNHKIEFKNQPSYIGQSSAFSRKGHANKSLVVDLYFKALQSNKLHQTKASE